MFWTKIVVCLILSGLLVTDASQADDKVQRSLESNQRQLNHKENRSSGKNALSDCKDCTRKVSDRSYGRDPAASERRPKQGNTRRANKPKKTTKTTPKPMPPFLRIHKIRIRVNEDRNSKKDSLQRHPSVEKTSSPRDVALPVRSGNQEETDKFRSTSKVTDSSHKVIENGKSDIKIQDDKHQEVTEGADDATHLKNDVAQRAVAEASKQPDTLRIKQLTADIHGKERGKPGQQPGKNDQKTTKKEANNPKNDKAQQAKQRHARKHGRKDSLSVEQPSGHASMLKGDSNNKQSNQGLKDDLISKEQVEHHVANKLSLNPNPPVDKAAQNTPKGNNRESKPKETKRPKVDTRPKETKAPKEENRPKNEKKEYQHEDVVIPASQGDKWSRYGLNAVPDVDRLEQRLHPTMERPVNDIIRGLERMFSHLQASLNHVEFNHVDIFNMTRWKYMTGVRYQLEHIAEENDRIYDAVMKTALLTKGIYRRAHERRRPANYTINSPPNAEFRYHSRKSENTAYHELSAAVELKDRLEKRVQEWTELTHDYIRLQTVVGGRLNSRALFDLQRRAKQTIRVLETAQHSGVLSRTHMYLTVGKGSTPDVSLEHSRDVVTRAYQTVTDAKDNFMHCKSQMEMIRSKLRGRVSGYMSDMPFDDTRMMLWVTVDSARIHADELGQRAAMIDWKLTPLLHQARKALSDTHGASMQQALNNRVRALTVLSNRLDHVMDAIRIEIGEPRFLEERCLTLVEGSGWGDSDDEDLEDGGSGDGGYDVTGGGPIDCSRFRSPVTSPEEEEVYGSGEAETVVDGSGEADSVLVTLDTSSRSGLVVNGNSAASDVQPFTPETIPGASTTSSSTMSGSATTSAPPTDTATTSEDIVLVDGTGPSPDSDGGDEGGDFVFTDLFGFFNDDAGGHADGDITLEEIRDEALIPIRKAPTTLNEAIRERLHNYSTESRATKTEAETVRSSALELSATWEKVSARFERLENRTLAAHGDVSRWRAEQISFRSVHDLVTDVAEHVDTQHERIGEQLKKAEDIADRKLKAMEEEYDRNKDRTETAPEPELVQETVTAVKAVGDTVQEIQRLTALHVDPCGTLQRHDRHFRSNITELRSKIAKAKLIASYLQMAVKLPSDGRMTLPVNDINNGDSPLLSSVRMLVKPSVDDGHLLTVNYNTSGSVAVTLEDKTPVLVQTQDGDDVTNTSSVELDTDSWYSVMLDRYASAHRLRVFDKAGTLSSDVSVAFDKTGVFDVTSVTSLEMGDDEHSAGCVGSLSVNGRLQKLFNNDTTIGECSMNSSPPKSATSIVFDGRGYVMYGFGRHRRVHAAELTFTANSDGPVLHVKNQDTVVLAWLLDGFLNVYIASRGGSLYLQSEKKVYGTELTLKLPTDFGIPRKEKVTLNQQTEGLKQVDLPPPDRSGDLTVNGLFIGGNNKNISSFVGCIRGVKINNIDVPLYQMDDVSDNLAFGVCPRLSCVTFSDDSTPVAMENLPKVTDVHVAVSRATLGQVIYFEKTGKFQLSVVINTEGEVEVSEALEDNSETLYLPKHGDNVVIAITDQPGDEAVHVRIGDVTEEFKYKGSGGAWGGWGNDNSENTETDDVTYTVIVGGNTEDSYPPLNGNVVQMTIDQREIHLDDFLTSNALTKCPSLRHEFPSPPVDDRPEFTCS